MDGWEQDGRLVVVSEYAPGGTLGDRLRELGYRSQGPSTATKIPVSEAVRITVGLLGGLEHLHNHGIIHRNATPESTYLPDGVPRLGDFSIAVHRSDLEVIRHSDICSGAPPFMPPEAFLNNLGFHTDLYAAGVTLYWMLVGELPYWRGEIADWARPRPLPPLPADLPEPIKDILTTALHNDPAHRFQSAAAFRKALLSAQEQPPKAAAPRLLAGRYRVLDTLSQAGGMAVTYLAEDTHMPSRRRCVVKVLRNKERHPDVARIVRERFEREANLLEQLGQSTDQIPKLHAYFNDGDQFFLVQELIEGDSLQSILNREGPAAPPIAAALLLSLLPVLAYIHSKGVIHRDIKPDNVILRRHDRKPVLIDFGAVKETVRSESSLLDAGTQSIIIGSPGFLPPEQAAGRPTYSSDLFSLGWTAISMLTGRPPLAFVADPHTGEVAWKDLVPSLGDRFGEVLDHSIRLNARDRFRSADEMLVALRDAVRDEGIGPLGQ